MLVACAALAWWGYVGLRGRRLHRAMLATARCAALAMVAVLLLQPVVEWPRDRTEADTVLVMVDRSRSLEVADERLPDGGRGSRDRRLRDILGLPVWARAAEKHQVRWLAFTGGLSAIPDPAQPPPLSGRRTLIASSLHEALRSMEGRAVGSVVLISDGRSQDVVDPTLLSTLRRDGVPVFVVPLGEGGGSRDRAIVEVEHPQRAFLRDRVPVRVSITAPERASIGVVLRDQASGEVLDRVEAVPEADGRLHATLTGDRATAGDVSWEVALEPEATDADPSNDRRPVEFVTVDRPIRVLYLEGRPRWEFRYLRSILLREQGVESSIMLLSADRDFAQEGTAPLSRLPATSEELEPFDVVIVGDVPSGALDPVRQRIIREQVARRGTGLVWIGGERATPRSWDGTPMQDLLPFTGSIELPRWDEPVLMQPTEEATRLGLLALGDEPGTWPAELGSQAQDWARLEWAQRIEVDQLKPAVETLATTGRIRIEGGMEASPQPLVLSMRYGAGSVVYVATDETWRWRHGRGETLQERFWIPLVRHLARMGLRSDPGAVVLTVDPASCVTRQPVRMTVDGGGRIAVQHVVVEARRVEGTETVEIVLPSEGDGRFGGTWSPPRDGTWSLRVTQPPVPTQEATMLSVRTEDAESRDTSPDHVFLETLARETGGAVVTPDLLHNLDQRLPDRSVTIRQPLQLPLWDRWPVYATLVLLLAAEWLGRRALRLQ